ncbi:Elongation factor 1-gamma [Daphnia magna]|uniref:Elongation factor 1-gamma n=1 Tax=Daphnia magna TaxID=35525 RepID=A0A162SFR6_9CRUS|nr:Elongation factor 1-gamma [Daphnia magna]
MASGTLYTYPGNFRANKALIAAQYSGFNINVASGFVFGETNKSESFLKKFPLGKVPAFESQDGQYIAESNAIAYFVANQQLRGNSDVEKAHILQWMSFADGEILPLSCTIVFPVLGIIQYNKQAVDHAKQELNAILSVVNNHLLTRTFLVGEKITLADIVLACNLLHLYENICDETNRKPFQNLNRWFVTCINQPQFKAVLGDFKMCQKECQVDPKKFAEFQRTFNMDDFKRFYSNNEEAKSIPYFWDKFDKENYSIWFGEYKYSDELTKVFMSANLIGGMYQRLDKMRKQCFASMCLFGTDNDSTISGVWVWRGQDLAFQLSPDWQIDYETYDWKKLDPDSEETKALVAQYFSWTGNDKNGRPFNQGKIFK